jgi:dienelactone hydrolase
MVLKSRQDFGGSGVAEGMLGHPGEIGARPGSAVPVVFSGCFGWMHPAGGRRAVVLCGPNGYEALCCHRPWGQFAAALAVAGLPVLRFDYPSSGDSAGADTEPAILRRAIDAILEAVNLMRRQPGVAEVALVGLRFGAVLAAAAAQELARNGTAVDALVLLAPASSGAAYAKELRVLSMMAKARRPNATSVPGLEAAGFYYTPETLAEMKALDPASAGERPAARVLVVDRADNPGGAALAEAFGKLGSTIDEAPFEGYNALMRDSADTVYPTADFARVIDWLRVDVPAPASHPLGFQSEIILPDGVDRPVWIDGATPLFAILSEPERPAAERPVLLIVSTGANHRIGINRMSLQIARRLLKSGVASLRLDLGGIGDSPSIPGRPDKTVLSPALVADVSQAVDWLARRGYRKIVVNGLCAGAWLSYHATVAEPRITGQILLNMRDLWPVPEAANKFESNRGYLRLLFASNTWARFLKGKVQVGAIAVVLLNRLRGSVAVRMNRLFGRGAAKTPAERAIAELTRLGARGVMTEFIYVESDRGMDELELHFGRRGKMISDLSGLRLTFLAEGDHLFSLKASRDDLLELVASRFEQPGTTFTAAEARSGAAPANAAKILKGSLT